MREDRSQLSGDQVISDSVDFWGTILGQVRIVKGGKMYLRGTIYGSMRVEDGGRVHLFGNVSGDLVVNEGAKVIVSGIVAGNCHNYGGRLYLDENARLLGKIKTHAGDTKIHNRAQVGEKRH